MRSWSYQPNRVLSCRSRPVPPDERVRPGLYDGVRRGDCRLLGASELDLVARLFVGRKKAWRSLNMVVSNGLVASLESQKIILPHPQIQMILALYYVC